MNQHSGKTLFAFLGSYADEADDSVYVCRFDPDEGELTVTDRASGLKNPTFLDVDPVRRTLYALNEETGASGERSGLAVAYKIDPAAGSLKELNRERTVEAATCHIHLDHTRQSLYTASYHGGLVGVNPILADGSIGPASQVIRHSGSSVLPAQTQARAHSVLTDPANRYAVVCDLGMDQVVSYRVDAAGAKLYRNGSTTLPPGSGPRHFAFHETLPYGYVINELSSTITAFRYNAMNGELTAIQTVSTLPDDYLGDNATADIHLSPDGRFLYGSNRGHDSIAVYSVHQGNGALSLVEHASTRGGHPRNFALSPDGRFLLAANRDGNNIVVFRRDEATGRLQPTGSQLQMQKPVCIRFAYL